MLQQVLDACCCPSAPPDIGCKLTQFAAYAYMIGEPTPKERVVYLEDTSASETEWNDWSAAIAAALPYNWYSYAYNVLTDGFTSLISAGALYTPTGWTGMLVRSLSADLSGHRTWWADYGDGYQEYEWSFYLNIRNSRWGGLLVAEFADSYGNSLSIRPNWDDGTVDVSGTRAADYQDYRDGVASSFDLCDFSSGPDALFMTSFWATAVSLLNSNGGAVAGGTGYSVPHTEIYPFSEENWLPNPRVYFAGAYSSFFPGDNYGQASFVLDLSGGDNRDQTAARALELLAGAPTSLGDSCEAYIQGWLTHFESSIQIQRSYTIVHTQSLGSLWTLLGPEANGGIIGDLSLTPQRFIMYGSVLNDYQYTAYVSHYAVGGSFAYWVAKKAIIGVTDDTWQVTQGQRMGNRAEYYASQPIYPRDCTNHFLPVGLNVVSPSQMVFEFGNMMIQRRRAWGIDPHSEEGDSACIDYNGLEGEAADEAWSESFSPSCSGTIETNPPYLS